MTDSHETAASTNQHSAIRTVRVLMAAFAVLALFAVALQKTELPAKAATGASVKQQLVGSWKLVSRVSRLDSGEIVPDPSLGEKPSGVLIYDASGHVAAQLSRQGRTMDIFKDECGEMTSLKTSPNTANTVFGYDAYFGTYTVHEKEGYVTHHLEMALWPGNIDKSINRDFKIEGDKLTIVFKTTTQDEKTVTRTLIWQKMR
jgi:lipocalin-like protein